jgi:diadenosine tetraphosphate (Ap4A) HIT family hydrolase
MLLMQLARIVRGLTSAYVEDYKIRRLNRERREVTPQPTVICELPRGVVVLYEELNMLYPGASICSLNDHVTEMFLLTSEERAKIMDDVSLVAEAV